MSAYLRIRHFLEGGVSRPQRPPSGSAPDMSMLICVCVYVRAHVCVCVHVYVCKRTCVYVVRKSMCTTYQHTSETFHLDNILLKRGHHAVILRQCSLKSPASVQLNQNPYKLEVESFIQYGKPTEYGVIKWIGLLPGRENIYYAGVEMVMKYNMSGVYYSYKK